MTTCGQMLRHVGARSQLQVRLHTNQHCNTLLNGTLVLVACSLRRHRRPVLRSLTCTTPKLQPRSVGQSMLSLRLATQAYAWGVPASQPSKVLELARANGIDGTLNPEPDLTFAELWVGTHPNGAATIPLKTAADPGDKHVSLESWLEHHPEALGHTLAQTRAVGQPTGCLPFLMKVLSINKALPLQAHPTSDAAPAMHDAHPDMYPDAAHKPEMVISLGGFAGFAGFLSPQHMQQTLQAYPQLSEVLGATNVSQYFEALQTQDENRRHLVLAAMWDRLLLRTPHDVAASVWSAVYAAMRDQAQAAHLPQSAHPHHGQPAAQPTGTVTSSGQHASSQESRQAATAAALMGPENVPKACDVALALSALGAKPGDSSQRYAMLSAAASAWPDDPVGILGLMLLEDVVLGPGESVVIPAGCPHAYICGEILEVQAASNNTIKGGLAASDEPTDKQGLVTACTKGLLSASGQDQTAGLLTDLSTSGAHAAATASGDTGSSSAAQPGSSKLTGGIKLDEGPPCQVHPCGLRPPSAAELQPGGGPELLQLYQPDVDEFQVLHCVVPDGDKVELVIDPGPAVMLVVSGSGKATLRASAVSDTHLLDEADLRPGTALFLAAGSSISVSSTSCLVSLEAWLATANNRLFETAAAAPAGEAEATMMEGMQLSPGPVRPHQGAAQTDVSAAFTAAEQVAAGIMMGAADSSTPATASKAAAAANTAPQQLAQMDMG